MNEEKYMMVDLDLLAIVYALRVWRHYLIGQKFELKTNHYGLQHLFTKNNLKAWKRHWSELLIDHDLIFPT